MAAAVKAGRIWLVNGTLSVLGEEPPPGFINETAVLHQPPLPLLPADLLPTQLPSAWDSSNSTAYHVHAALSSKAGKPLPWGHVRQAIAEVVRLGLVELALDCGPWPCDLGGAAAVKLKARKDEIRDEPRPLGARAAEAELESHEVQELAERIDELRRATAGQRLRIKVSIHVGESNNLPADMIAEVNALLSTVKPNWRLS